MEVGYHQILKGIVLTSKSAELYKKQGKITFYVCHAANKSMVKDAVEKVWDVKVGVVRVINLPGKRRRSSGKYFKTSMKRKAVVALKEGYNIDLSGQFDSAQLPQVSGGKEQGGK